ncbi:hypothetical protein BZG02_12985 [Labilibaculum filiforme]|uniref:Uncharacterized protein n=1 Tax=Labilibaculum filiforme TaxID=1940526 RepID=A0A2N3HW17_9BACT|nr:hypothetical protein BZG02_12985 [Labilibaculum filiforme]
MIKTEAITKIFRTEEVETSALQQITILESGQSESCRILKKRIKIILKSIIEKEQSQFRYCSFIYGENTSIFFLLQA